MMEGVTAQFLTVALYAFFSNGDERFIQKPYIPPSDR